MPIEADSAAWTGGDDARDAVLVCAEFQHRAALDAAIALLERSEFPRSDLSVRVLGETAPAPADNPGTLRTLGTSAVAAGTAMAAAGAVIATGGAALPAIAAAAVAAGAGGAAGAAVGSAAAPDIPAVPPAAIGEGTVLRVSAKTPERREMAAGLLRQAAASRVWRAGPD